MQLRSADQHHWGVILAGGEGVRLRSLTRLVSGDDIPKQFCPLFGGRTLLEQTRQRIARKVAPERTTYVLLNSHERFYSKELQNVPPARLIAQPCNRGTLPAILSSLCSIVREDPDAIVGFFPSDHHYAEEDKFMCGVELAYAAAETNPSSVILLGVAAQHAEIDYGWIEAEPAVSTQAGDGVLRVKRFWEKPSPRTARELLERGCVWNTFVMAGRARAFLDLIRGSVPQMFQEFEEWLQPNTMGDDRALATIYGRLAPADFSKQVLSQASDRVGVLCLGDVGWSDLGDPRRVVAMLAQTGVTSQWMTLWQEHSSAAAAGL